VVQQGQGLADGATRRDEPQSEVAFHQPLPREEVTDENRLTQRLKQHGRAGLPRAPF
jgi:hypothetical protein